MARDSKQRARLKKLTAAAKAAAIKRNSCTDLLLLVSHDISIAPGARTVLDRTGTGTTDAAFATPTMTEVGLFGGNYVMLTMQQNMGQGVFAMDTMSTFSPEEDALTYEIDSFESLSSGDECTIDLVDNEVDGWVCADEQGTTYVLIDDPAPAHTATGLKDFDDTSGHQQAWGHGPKTVQRRERAAKLLVAEAKRLHLKPITSFFSRPGTTGSASSLYPETPQVAGFSRVALSVLIEQLAGRLNTVSNVRKAATEFKDVNIREVFRLRALHVYFVAVADGLGRMKASLLAAKVLGRGKYYPDTW